MTYLCHIDPSASMRALVSRLALGSGWESSSHADLPEAIVEIRARLPDLIITASALPSARLAEIVAALRADSGLAAIPVVLFTDSTRRKTVAPALELGVAEVFFKEDSGALQKYLKDISPHPPGIGLAKRRALVLDDDRTTGIFLRAALQQSGIETEVHGTIESAQSALRAGQHDIVIADIVLGDGPSGNSFIREVRQWGGMFTKMPIVAISGFLDSARRIESLRAGATLCLAKPIAGMELILVLENLLSIASQSLPGAPCVACAPGVADLPELTEREHLICRMAVKGVPDKEMARQLGISYWTVRTYMGRIFRKVGVANRVELASRCLAPEMEPVMVEAAPEPCPDWMSLSAHVVDNLHHGVVITDATQRILWVNLAFTHITGFAAAEAIGQTPRILKSGKQDTMFYREMLGQLAEEGHWTGEIWNRHKEGRLFLEWLEIRSLPPGAPDNACYVGLISDITERRLEAERIRHSALHDALTGLANRILLRDRADQEIARSRREKKPLAVAFIDLDRFKPINDTLGHDAGDAILREVAVRLRAQFRANDTLARYGGDEFVAILPDVGNRENALSAAAKILCAFDAPFQLNGNDFRLGASVGISLYPEDGSSFDELIVCSDRAMYRAKESGGSRIRAFERDMNALAEDSLLIENRLFQALKRGEFVLCFQPKVDTETRRVVGAEALVRWIDPERGVVPPNEFIPLAERTGLILPIGSWILRESCRVLRRIHDAGFKHFSIAVNVSPLQVSGCDFVTEIETVLAETGVTASGVQLEITESIFIRDPKGTTDVLNQLVKTGISLALDDFGTGYSSLGYLKILPFDTIKVDRQFIANIHADRYNAAIMQATIQLAGGLDMSVVAEGVESEKELSFLRSIGCSVAQGYLFARPMNESDLMVMLATDAGQSKDMPVMAET